MRQFFQKKVFDIPYYEIIAVLCFYTFFAYVYHCTLFFNRWDGAGDLSPLFSPLAFMQQAGLQYVVKLLFSLPIWYVLFRVLKKMVLQRRVLLHFLVLPFWILICQKSYYFLAESLDWGHLRGSGEVWDIYIPALFYVLQFGLLHAYEYYHTSQAQLKEKAALKEAALKSELTALKAQLNPHFLYNVFNTISASVPSEQEETRELIAKLSDLFRYQLRASKTELVSLGEELDFVEKYLDLEKARFEDRLRIDIDVPKGLYTEKVPAMLLQPLVENALKHGLAPLIGGGAIRIEVEKRQGKLHFCIADTGVGVQDVSAVFDVGVGLTNTKLRLEKMYGTPLQVSKNEPSGLKIEFEL